MPVKKKSASSYSDIAVEEPAEPAVAAPVEKPKVYDPTDPTIPGSPAYLREVGEKAWARNHPTERKPAPAVQRWLVSYNDLTATVSAVNEPDAWAMACDQWKRWPNPRTPARHVELLS